MPIDETKVNNLQTIAKPSVCEILAVYWSDSVTKYYANRQIDDLANFRNCPLKPIEVRLKNEKFHAFSIGSDLADKDISFVFADDKERSLAQLFKTYGEVRCELFYWFSEVELLVKAWWGQLLPPTDFGSYELQASASNGFRSRDLIVPGRMKTTECGFTHGKYFDNLADLATAKCQHNRHLGGTNGLPGTGFCPALTPANCLEQWGDDTRIGNFPKDIANFVYDTRGLLGISKGDPSQDRTPIQVVMGSLHVQQLPILAFRREPNPNNHDLDFASVLVLISEGPIQRFYNIMVNESWIGQEHISVRLGTIGQPPTPYASNVGRYSGTAVAMIRFRYKDVQNLTPNSINVFGACEGFSLVPVYSDVNTLTHQFSNNRVWCLLSVMTNQTWGRRYKHERFSIADWVEVAEWTKQYVRITDANGTNYDHYRTSFDAVLEPRASQELIRDIARAGRFSIPYQYDGKYSITALRKWSVTELENCQTFSVRGEETNVLEIATGKYFEISYTPKKDLINEVVVEFRESQNLDKLRPITADDKTLQKETAKIVGGLGKNTLRISGFGIRSLGEALKLAKSILWFGEFDNGGLQNNLRVSFRIPFHQILLRKKYDVIRIVDVTVNGFQSPQNQVFEYFRILDMPKDENNVVTVICQAYNPSAYNSFETEIAEPETIEPQLPEPHPSTCTLEFGNVTYDSENNFLVIPIENC